MLEIPVGPVTYKLCLKPGWLMLNGERCHGYCNRDTCEIYISDAAPAPKRMATAWHEIAHAWCEELDIDRGRESYSEESVCNLAGLVMASMDERVVAKVRVYMTTGMMPHDVMLLTGCPGPIPVLKLGHARH